MKTRFINQFQIIIALVAVVFINNACSEADGKSETKTKAPKTIAVKATKVEKFSSSIPVHVLGKLASGQESQLSFKTSGIIHKIYVNDGQKVKKGQLLAQLDLSEINAQVQRAEAAFKNAKRDLERLNKLYEDKVVTLESLENAQTAFDVAKSDLEIAQFNQSHSTITAPSTGQIFKKYVDEHELVNAGSPVFTFGSTQNYWVVKTGLVDKEVVKIQLGDSASIEFDAIPGKHFHGTITKISNAPDPFNGTYETEVSIPGISAQVKSGFISKVKIYPAQKSKYQLIPLVSLKEAEGNSGIVYVPHENHAIKKKINIEDFMDDKLIVKNLDSDSVITEGIHKINDNDLIAIVK